MLFRSLLRGTKGTRASRANPLMFLGLGADLAEIRKMTRQILDVEVGADQQVRLGDKAIPGYSAPTNMNL